jgi:RecJ-like exonuclease
VSAQPLREFVECPACEGAGNHAAGEFGAYYRDGYTYDSPGMVVCEDCAGAGRLEADQEAE